MTPRLTQYPEHIIGCTGVPVDSHETLWLSMNQEKEFTRCPRCGSGMYFYGSPQCTRWSSSASTATTTKLSLV